MAGNDTNVDGFKDNVAYDGPSITSEWLVNGNATLGNSVVEASSAPSAHSCPPIWENQSIDVLSLGYCDMNVGTNASSLSSLGGGVNWMRDGIFMPAMLPHSLPPFPSDATDPDFIERAARFSCFSDILCPCGFPDPVDPCSRGYRPMKPSPAIEGEFKNEKITGVQVSVNEAGFNGVDVEKNLVGLKKRKRSKQKPEKQEDNRADSEKANGSGEIKQKGNVGGKEERRGCDPAEEGYIHVRARRGEATNSHSLAERMRREKISERMKHLQDLVPGCNKVTGKAVMLDEIINYVQSLQRQVEFLSMKLATVNPQLELGTQGFFAKDILQSGAGLPCLPPCITMPFPPVKTNSSYVRQS